MVWWSGQASKNMEFVEEQNKMEIFLKECIKMMNLMDLEDKLAQKMNSFTMLECGKMTNMMGTASVCLPIIHTLKERGAEAGSMDKANS